MKESAKHLARATTPRAESPLRECGVVLVEAQWHVDDVRAVPVPSADGVFAPPIVRMIRQHQAPGTTAAAGSRKTGKRGFKELSQHPDLSGGT